YRSSIHNQYQCDNNYYTNLRKHSTNSFIHILSPTLHPVEQLSKCHQFPPRSCWPNMPHPRKRYIKPQHKYKDHHWIAFRQKIYNTINFYRSKVVRLTIWDNEAANFRGLNHISTRKNQIVIITSIIPRLHEGKQSLTTTLGSRFYFDSDIDIIQRFQKRNKLRS
ncbi:hypothetical protein HID58_061535, partial [Brassica napus]